MLGSGSTQDNRSALIAFGDLGDAAASHSEVVPTILKSFVDFDERAIVELAVAALASMRDGLRSHTKDISPVLLRRFRHSPKIFVRKGVITLLGLLSPEDLTHAELDLLRECLRQGFNGDIQKEAAQALLTLSRSGFRLFEHGAKLKLERLSTLASNGSTRRSHRRRARD